MEATRSAEDHPHSGNRSTLSRIAMTAAGVAGVLHAASSLYWAFGGRWLLPTVGAWAVEAAEDSPVATGLALGFVGLVKLLAVTVPLGLAKGWVPWPRLWRAVCWVGAVVIFLYGSANVAVSGAVLTGIISTDEGYARAAMLGHALLWDPLFAIWGAALILWLLISSKPSFPRTR